MRAICQFCDLGTGQSRRRRDREQTGQQHPGASGRRPRVHRHSAHLRSRRIGRDDLGANGVLGVGLFVNDGQLYYNCNPTSRFNDCRTTLTVAQQVQNPVALFPTDNNGVVLQLPAVSSGGAVRVDGQMVFGIDTQSNNRLGDAKVIQTDSSGFFTTIYRGVTMPNSFIDSGSNGIYFDDSSLRNCAGNNTGFYCPLTTQSLTATMTLKGGATDVVPFDIANADTPNFKARDIDFKTAYNSALSGRSEGGLSMNRTAAMHLPGTDSSPLAGALRYRTEYQSAADGNTVNMDIERAAFAENAIQMEAMMTFINGRFRTLQSAVQGQ